MVLHCLKTYELALLADGRADWLLVEKATNHFQYCRECERKLKKLLAPHKTMKPLFNLKELDTRGWRVSRQLFFNL